MKAIEIVAGEIIPEVLDESLRDALTAKYVGLQTAGQDEPIVVYLVSDATEADEDMVREVVAQHYPVFLTVDKPVIQANGLDVATVFIRVRQDPTITLTVNGLVYPVDLAGGLGSVEIVSLDPTPIVIGVIDPQDRPIDLLEMEAQ